MGRGISGKLKTSPEQVGKELPDKRRVWNGRHHLEYRTPVAKKVDVRNHNLPAHSTADEHHWNLTAKSNKFLPADLFFDFLL
jgi:hypothetical protein